MENYFELFEAAAVRRPSIVRAEIADLRQKIERAEKSLIEADNRIAGYKLDTDPKHANTVANKIRAAEKEKQDTYKRIESYKNNIATLEEEVKAWFRQKTEDEINKDLSEGPGEVPPKVIITSYNDIVSFLLAKKATISFESASDKVNRLRWLLPDLEDNQINIIDANRRTSGGYRMKFGISGYIRVSDLDGLPAGYLNYFNGTTITEINKVVAIVRSNFDALSPLIITHGDDDGGDDDTFKQDFPDINAYGETLTEGKDDKYTCCICGEECTGYGNNPEPYKHEGKCCDACNLHFVIPARMALAGGEEE